MKRFSRKLGKKKKDRDLSASLIDDENEFGSEGPKNEIHETDLRNRTNNSAVESDDQLCQSQDTEKLKAGDLGEVLATKIQAHEYLTDEDGEEPLENLEPPGIVSDVLVPLPTVPGNTGLAPAPPNLAAATAPKPTTATRAVCAREYDKGTAGTLPASMYLAKGQDDNVTPVTVHSCKSCGAPFETFDMFCVCCGEKRVDMDAVPSNKEVKGKKVPTKTKLRQPTAAQNAISSPKSLFCVFCGGEYDSEDAAFCTYCGQDRDNNAGLLLNDGGQGQDQTSMKDSNHKRNAHSGGDVACSSCSCAGQPLFGSSSAWTSCSCAFAGQMYGCHCQPDMLLAPQDLEQENLDFDGPCCESDAVRNCVTKITLLSILIWASFMLSLAAFSTPAWAYFSVICIRDVSAIAIDPSVHICLKQCFPFQFHRHASPSLITEVSSTPS
jgi:hypothetical protein